MEVGLDPMAEDKQRTAVVSFPLSPYPQMGGNVQMLINNTLPQDVAAAYGNDEILNLSKRDAVAHV